MNQIARDFSHAARRYNEYADVQMHVLAEAAQAFSEIVPSDALVLDAGCGTGAFADYSKNPLIGCDVAEGMCAQTRYPSLCADMSNISIKDQCIDAVFSSLALQWLEEKPLALAELCRVVKAGGKALVTTLGPSTLKELREMDVPTLSFLDEETYVLFAKQAGWQVLSSKTEILEWDYESLFDLLKSIKSIGARHKHRRGYLRKSELQQPISATWEVITLQLQKPEV